MGSPYAVQRNVLATLALPDNSNSRNSGMHTRIGLSTRKVLYAIPRNDSPRTSIGDPVNLRCSEHLQFIVSLIDALLPRNFQATMHSVAPFAFAGKKDELSVPQPRSYAPTGLTEYFTIRPTFILEAKIIETVRTRPPSGCSHDKH